MLHLSPVNNIDEPYVDVCCCVSTALAGCGRGGGAKVYLVISSVLPDWTNSCTLPQWLSENMWTKSCLHVFVHMRKLVNENMCELCLSFVNHLTRSITDSRYILRRRSRYSCYSCWSWVKRLCSDPDLKINGKTPLLRDIDFPGHLKPVWSPGLHVE